MLNLSEILTLPSIAAMVYTVMDIFKTVVGEDNEKYKRLIPGLACVLGAVTGIVCFSASGNAAESDNVLMSVILGAASGLSSTGIHQAAKQLSRDEGKKEQAVSKKNDITQRPENQSAGLKEEDEG